MADNIAIPAKLDDVIGLLVLGKEALVGLGDQFDEILNRYDIFRVNWAVGFYPGRHFTDWDSFEESTPVETIKCQ